MRSLTLLVLFVLLVSPTALSAPGETITLDRLEYAEKLRGFWLGSCIANWTGLATENMRTDVPFLTDDDWGKVPAGRQRPLDFVLDQDPWLADDDTDIEYVYQHALEQYDTHLLSGEQISAEWREHIGLPRLWVSNLAALGQMQNGALPPATSLPENNPMWDMIDAQLTTEIFGVLAPARPDVALEMAHLPIRTTAYLHSEWAAEFYVVMHALASVVDPALARKEQLMWLADRARARVPEWSYVTDMYDFVKADYLANPDKDNWELTRDRVYERYQRDVTAGYRYRYPWDAGINFAASIVSLFYGEGDYKKTVRIGTLAGWDSDNPTATWGGLLGYMYGHDELRRHFGDRDFADAYNIERTRSGLPFPVDSIRAMSARALEVIDRVVTDGMGGTVTETDWVIPNDPKVPRAEVPETIVPWTTIEDDDPRWSYEGFVTRPYQWNASGATLTVGAANCSAEVTFNGTAVQYFAYRGPSGGTVSVTLDGVEHGPFDLQFDGSPHGQHYVKIFERHGLARGEHTLRIKCDGQTTEKTIDMLSVIEG